MLEQILGRPLPPGVTIYPPFYTDHGLRLELAERVFINQGCTFLDYAGIRLGAGVMVGPQGHLHHRRPSGRPAGAERGSSPEHRSMWLTTSGSAPARRSCPGFASVAMRLSLPGRWWSTMCPRRAWWRAPRPLCADVVAIGRRWGRQAGNDKSERRSSSGGLAGSTVSSYHHSATTPRGTVSRVGAPRPSRVRAPAAMRAGRRREPAGCRRCRRGPCRREG